MKLWAPNGRETQRKMSPIMKHVLTLIVWAAVIDVYLDINPIVNN